MFWRRTNVPTNLAMFTKCCTSVGASVSHNFGARQSNGLTIEIIVSKKRSMGGQRRMDTRRSQQIECQNCLRKKSIPLSHGKVGVNAAQRGNQMIFEGVNCSLGGISSMFFGRHTLEVNFIFCKRIFDFLTAFVIKNVNIRRSMALLKKPFVNCFPGIVDADGLTIRNGNHMNGVGVVVVKDKNIIVASTGRNRKAAGLIGIRFDDLGFFKQH